MWSRWAWLGVASLLGASSVWSQDAPPLADCVAALRKELPLHSKVRAEVFDRHTADARDLRSLIEKAGQAQPEFQLPIWDYLARRTDAERISQGRELMAREAGALEDIARRHGVDPATTVAVFGVETDYGRVAGAHPVVDATLSRACLNLGSAERKRNFFAALWLLQEGHVRQDEFRGSWAGAFGMTQFMPATFLQYMSDAEGGPVADVFHSVPDALATTARYLRGLGWSDRLPWGIEVAVPAPLVGEHAPEGEHACLAKRKPEGKCRSLSQWAAAGVTRVDGSALLGAGLTGGVSGTLPAALLIPAGPRGPAWLLTSNYQAVWRYNRADAYALAIGLLSDRLQGAPAQRAPWPTDDPGLSRAEFKELQALLVQRGRCEIRVDGAEGPMTSAAIRDEELRLGWPQSGRAGARLLARLRLDAATPTACREAASVATPVDGPR